MNEEVIHTIGAMRQTWGEWIVQFIFSILIAPFVLVRYVLTIIFRFGSDVATAAYKGLVSTFAKSLVVIILAWLAYLFIK